MDVEFTLENSGIFTQFFQSTFPNLLATMQAIHIVTEPELCFFLFLAIYWGINRDKGSRYLYLLGLILAVFSILQHLLQFPAPFWFDSGLMQKDSGSFSAPNVHVAIALVLLLPFKRFMRTDLALPTFALAGLIAGSSQIYLGIAGLADVALGLLLGVTLILLWSSWNKRYGKNFSQRILGQRFWAAITFPAVLSIVYLLLINTVEQIGSAGFHEVNPGLHRRAWQTGYINAITALGILTAAGVGISLESARVRFRPDVTLFNRIINLIIGFVLLGGMLYLASAISISSPDYDAAGVPIILVLATKFGVLTFVCVYVIPWIFTIIGTATAEVAPLPTISLKNYTVEQANR